MPSVQRAATTFLRSASSAASTAARKSSSRCGTSRRIASSCAGMSCLSPADQRAGDVGGDRGDQPQPVRRQRRREHRDADDARLAADGGAERAHHVLVAQEVGPADVVDAARRLGQRGDADQVLDQVGQRDRRRLRLHPARRHHHRQVVDEVADHLVGGGAGADDDAGAQFGHRNGPGAQRVAGLLARDQVLGLGRGRHESAEIDDAPNAASGGRTREVLGRLDIELAEVAARRHRVDEVVRGVDAGERGHERFRLQRIGLHQLDAAPGARLQHLDVARGGAHAAPSGDEGGHEVGADVAAGAEHQRQRRGCGRAGGRRGTGAGGGHRQSDRIGMPHSSALRRDVPGRRFDVRVTRSSSASPARLAPAARVAGPHPRLPDLTPPDSPCPFPTP